MKPFFLFTFFKTDWLFQAWGFSSSCFCPFVSVLDYIWIPKKHFNEPLTRSRKKCSILIHKQTVTLLHWTWSPKYEGCKQATDLDLGSPILFYSMSHANIGKYRNRNKSTIDIPFASKYYTDRSHKPSCCYKNFACFFIKRKLNGLLRYEMKYKQTRGLCWNKVSISIQCECIVCNNSGKWSK